ncbi:MAG: SLC13 family permease [Eubacteriales bacterium]|nr:SLC13 family permease [Eubacteriales bacterium]
MLARIGRFFRREKVLTLSLGAAFLSALLVAPDKAYAGYVDWNVLMLLFALMAVVAGVKSRGVFDRVSRGLCRVAGNLRRLSLLLTLFCFFFAMLVTNDVALITFVPLTVLLLSAVPDTLIYVVSLETVAANLGSMATPIGNPQNLYLYAHYDMRMDAFFSAVLPLCALSLVLIMACCLLVPKTTVAIRDAAPIDEREAHPSALPKPELAVYSLQFLCCLLTVFKLLPKAVCFGVVLISMLIVNPKALKQVDYALLGTFVCFFVFVGNLGRLEAFAAFLNSVMAGNELETGVLASQVISNVPAALMLSGFTDNQVRLLQGVNIGGLGTLVASLASLISFKLYTKSPGARAGAYLKVFTIMNILFLAVLYATAKWIL